MGQVENKWKLLGNLRVVFIILKLCNVTKPGCSLAASILLNYNGTFSTVSARIFIVPPVEFVSIM